MEFNRQTIISFPNDAINDITTGIVSGSLSLEEILCSKNITFGEFNSTKFEAQVYNLPDVANKHIEVYQIVDENKIIIFTGIVDSCKKDDSGYYRDIVAYDYSYSRRDTNVADWWDEFWENHSSTTLKQFRASLLSYMNIRCVDKELFNDNLKFTKPADLDTMPFGTLISAICQLQLCFPHMNRLGTLEFITLSTNKANVLNVTEYEGNNCEFETYSTANITRVQIFEGNDLMGIAGTSGNNYSIKDNIIISAFDKDAVQTLAENMLTQLTNITLVPCTIKMLYNHLEYKLGDYILANNNYSYIMSNAMSGVQLVEQTIKAQADEYLSQTTEYNTNVQYTKDKVDRVLATLDAEYIKTDAIDAKYATIKNLDAANAAISNLKTYKLDATYAEIINANVESLKAANAAITQLKANSLTADIADLNYAKIDFANVKGQVVTTSLIKDGAVTNEKVQNLSANKITSGEIDASKIKVYNLNADYLTVGYINGKRIGSGSIELDKLAEEVPTKEYLDKVQEELQGQIDGNIETFTKTEIPTLSNEPAVNWTDNATRKKHIGDICYVVNPASSADGYSYRFANTGTEQAPVYEWVLIKDSDVTKALQDIININGEITGIKKFNVEISSWKTDTDSELSSLKTRTTSLETDMGNKVDTTTFNEVKQTVDENSSTITKMSETVSKKADSSTVTALSNTVNSIKQTADSNSSSISSLTTTVTKVENTANNASKTASEAKTAASKAETAANNSATNASNAASKANAAATSASNAEKSASNSASSASSAATSAANAKKSADTANTNASAAVSTANTAKSTADSAKSTATAANNTANTAKSTADSALSKVNTLTTTVTNQGSSITQLQTSINNKVWKQDITESVNNIQVGGRNLLKGTHKTEVTYTYPTSSYADRGSWVTTVPLDADYYTLSFWAKSTKAGDRLRVHFYNPSDNVLYQASQGQTHINGDGMCDFVLSTTLTHYWVTYKLQTKGKTRSIVIPRLFASWGSSGGTLTFKWEKVEEGTKATAWSPAPEDIDSSINAVDNKVTTVSNQYTTLNQTVNSISGTVNSHTEQIKQKADNSTVTTINNKVTSLTTDLSGFKTTVSNTYATKNSLSNYATTAAMNSAISQSANSITQSVSATYATKSSLSSYATTASLSAYIAKTDTGTLKSCIEAIADTINITARGGLNLSGNRFTLSSTNTTITTDGTITTKKFVGNGGTIGGWNIDSTSIYSDYLYNDNVGYGKYRVSLNKSTGSDSKIFSVRETVKDNVFNYPFFVRSDGHLYTVKGQISGFQFDSNKMSKTVSIYLLPDKDVLHTLRNALVNHTTSQLALSQYDLNGNGEVNLADFVVAKNYVLGTHTEADFRKWKYAKTSNITYNLNPSDVKNALSISGTDIWGKTRQTTLGIGTLYSNEISCDNLIVKDPVDYSTFNTFLNTINVRESSTSIDLANYTRNYVIRGNGMLIVNISVWTDTTDDYGTTAAEIYIDDKCVTENRHRMTNSHPSELACGTTFVWWFNDNTTHHIQIKAGSSKEGTKTYTQSIQALFGLQISTS